MSSGDPETRLRILEETRRLMIEQQGKNVRLEDIAKAAGVSRQAIYMHFGSRPGLLVATARYLDDISGLDQRTQPIRDAANGIDMIRAYIEFWARYIPDIYGLAKALLNARDIDEAAAAAWDDRMKAVYQKCRDTVLCLVQDDLLAPEWTVETASDFFWTTISITGWEHLTLERGWTTEEYIERITRVLERTLVRDS
ncbi:MAG: TetR/AcrR family transcriptional regulator [Anaerolineae bacterium]|nr:TetR/AcrR family transcriptional regulator [Anaerolineae bacterium]